MGTFPGKGRGSTPQRRFKRTNSGTSSSASKVTEDRKTPDFTDEDNMMVSVNSEKMFSPIPRMGSKSSTSSEPARGISRVESPALEKDQIKTSENITRLP